MGFNKREQESFNCGRDLGLKIKERVTVVHKHSFSFMSMLAILFIALKLTGSITWSWWLVLLPIYWSYALLLTILLVVIIGILILGFLSFLVNSLANLFK